MQEIVKHKNNKYIFKTNLIWYFHFMKVRNKDNVVCFENKEEINKLTMNVY